MNEITQTDNDTTAIFYFSDDAAGGGAGDTSTVTVAGLASANADGTDRIEAVAAWWSVDGAVQLEANGTLAGFVQFMDFTGNSGGWVSLPRINFNSIVAAADCDGEFRINNAAGVNFSLCIKFEKTKGFSSRPRFNKNEGDFTFGR